MGRWWKTNACERATQWISLDLDGELSQLEQTALQRHISGCAQCREASAEVNTFTRMLREAPLLELERELAYALPRRARVRAVRRAAFTLAFAVLTGAAVFAGFVLPSSEVGTGSALAFRSAQEQKRFAHFEARRLEPAVFAVTPALPTSFGARARLD